MGGGQRILRIAAPLVGGIVTSFLLELIIYPPLYQIWKRRDWRRSGQWT